MIIMAHRIGLLLWGWGVEKKDEDGEKGKPPFFK